MTSKRSYHLIRLLMLIGVSIQQRISLQIYQAYNITHRMVDLNLKLLKNGARHLRDNGDVRFYLSARAL